VQHKEVQSACVKSIGEGDGGGGTLRADLEMARRLCDLEGVPRAAWKTVSAALEKGSEYPHKELLDCWKGTLTNQFHDIIPGSSIGRVYSEAEAASQQMLIQLENLAQDAKIYLVDLHNKKDDRYIEDTVFLFNDLSWSRRSPVSIPVTSIDFPDTPDDVIPIQAQEIDAMYMLSINEDMAYPVQFYVDFDKHKRLIFSPRVPSLAWARYAIIYAVSCISCFTWQDDVLETPFYKIKFDATGRITSLYDNRSKREMVAPGGVFNAFISAEDIPVFWDAWDIDADWVNHIEQETRLVSTELVTIGPELFCLRRVYDIGRTSCLIQDMMCYGNDPRIDFVTKVDWHEQHRLLKVGFDTAIDATQVRCEVQYGHIWRNTHRNLMQDRAKFEICAHKWISLEEEGFGIALLNDCKYGHDVEGGRMRLSLLRSPVAPDPEADQGEHRFTYSLLPFAGNFGSSGVINSAYELNSPVEVLVSNEDKSFPSIKSLCTVDGNAVIIESIKMPEDASPGELILRLYESLGGKCKTTLHFSRDFTAAAETDMLEENPRPLPVQGGDIYLEFRPFEIKTLRLGF
jgi:alpha-mannosidase